MSKRWLISGAGVLVVGIAIGATLDNRLDSEDGSRVPAAAPSAMNPLDVISDHWSDAQAAVVEAQAAAEQARQEAGEPVPHGAYVLPPTDAADLARRGCPSDRRGGVRTNSLACRAMVAIAIGELEPGQYTPEELRGQLAHLGRLPTLDDLIGATADTTCAEMMMRALKSERISEGQEPHSYPPDLMRCVN